MLVSCSHLRSLVAETDMGELSLVYGGFFHQYPSNANGVRSANSAVAHWCIWSGIDDTDGQLVSITHHSGVNVNTYAKSR